MGGETVAIQSSLISRRNKEIERVLFVNENNWDYDNYFFETYLIVDMTY
jgi:hypothetical protein